MVMGNEPLEGIETSTRTPVAREYNERCKGVLRIYITQNLGKGVYFGNESFGSSIIPSQPAIVIIPSGVAKPQGTGYVTLISLRKLGSKKVQLENGFDADAQVYEAGDKRCAKLGDAILSGQ